MAGSTKAIFTREFNWTRDPKDGGLGFRAMAADTPQQFPRDFIAAAVAAGAATEVTGRSVPRSD